MRETKKTLGELSACMKKYPQILINVKVKEKKPFEELPALKERLKSSTERLKNEGRILLRYSGTEKLARVMVEGKDKNIIEEVAQGLAQEIKKAIGA
jgi:phosphoglucosamine mutase